MEGFFSFCFSQNVGINPNGTLPNSSAGLDVDFTNKGVLIPRLTAVQRFAIPNPANGLLVFDTDSDCFFFYKTVFAQWTSLCSLIGAQGPPGPPGPAGSGQIISLSGDGWSIPADNTGFHIVQNCHVNFSDILSVNIQMRFTGECYQSPSTNATATYAVLINGSPIWTSSPFANAFSQPFDSGLINFSNPGVLSTVSISVEGITLSGPQSFVGPNSFLITFK